jgi:hypothetical protein
VLYITRLRKGLARDGKWGLLTDEGEADGSEGGCCHREKTVVDELLVERELIGRAFKFHKVLNETDLEAHVDRMQTLVLPFG